MSASEHSAHSNGGSCRLIYARTRDGGNRKSFSYFISLLKGSKLKDITACRHDYLPGSNIRFFFVSGFMVLFGASDSRAASALRACGTADP